MTENRPDLIMRMKDDGDNVVPSGNSVAILNGMKLTQLTKNPVFEERASQTLKFFSDRLTRHPTSLSLMLVGLDFRCGSPLI